MDPSRFRVGDIVEVALSFACFETKGKKYIMIPILHAITLFDQEIRNVSLYYSVPSIVDPIYRLLIYCACVNITKSYHKCKVKEPEPRFMKTPLISQTHRRE